jgi:hypothetical protein
MSGINSRLIHDTCAQSQKIHTSCAPADYSMYLDYYINPTFKTSKDVPCGHSAKTIGCLACETNSNAMINLGPDSFVKLATIEDNLRGTIRNLTLCSNEKFMSCQVNPNAANRIPGECDNFITVNPYLCDRTIVPTNLKFPTTKGFK